MRLAIPTHDVATYVRGQEIGQVTAGDLILVRHHGCVPSAIRFAERLRRPRGISRADWNAYCRVNHACIALSPGPTVLVVQTTAKGIVVSSLHEMDYYAIAVVHLDMGSDQQAGVVDFARDSVGCGYGFLQAVADLLNAATGLELSMGWGDRMVCSTAACRAIERSSFIPDRSPDCVTPAHLSWYLGAIVPAD